MSFFEELYHGDVYPEEEIAESIAIDQRYRELRNQISRLRERLCAETDDDVRQIMRSYLDSYDRLLNLHELHSFKVGFIRGAELKNEITKTNDQPSV